METGERIVGKNEDISYRSVAEFFEQRGNNKLKHKYNYVIYLDNSPDVAVLRDKQAKKLVGEKLHVSPGMTVLDIGCGIGRWGEWFCPQGVYYVGIDGSAKMIERAQENLATYEKKQLIVGDAREIQKIWSGNCDIVFVYGVLMYLNDNDVMTLLKGICDICDKNAQVCFIESMSEKTRLTLKDIYSEELKQNYSAIYRSVDEFKQMMSEAFSGKLTLACDEVLDFADGMQKKREHVTMEHCMVWKAR